MENMTSPASNNKGPYRGEGGGGEHIKQYQKQRYTFLETSGLSGRVDSPVDCFSLCDCEDEWIALHGKELAIFA